MPGKRQRSPNTISTLSLSYVFSAGYHDTLFACGLIVGVLLPPCSQAPCARRDVSTQSFSTIPRQGGVSRGGGRARSCADGEEAARGKHWQGYTQGHPPLTLGAGNLRLGRGRFSARLADCIRVHLPRRRVTIGSLFGQRSPHVWAGARATTSTRLLGDGVPVLGRHGCDGRAHRC